MGRIAQDAVVPSISLLYANEEDWYIVHLITKSSSEEYDEERVSKANYWLQINHEKETPRKSRVLRISLATNRLASQLQLSIWLFDHLTSI